MSEPLTGSEVKLPPLPERETGPFRIVIEASDWDETRITEAVVATVVQRFEHKVADRIQAAVSAAVQAAIERVVDAEVLAKAREILDAGWPETNQYGVATGRRVSFAERVSTLISSTSSWQRRSRLEEVVQDLVDKSLRDDLGKEVEAARAKVRAMLDDAIDTKLRAAFKQAFGLKE